MLPTSPVLASAPYPLVLSPGTNSLQGPLRGSDLAPTHLLRPAGPLGTPAGMWEGSGAPGTVGQAALGMERGQWQGRTHGHYLPKPRVTTIKTRLQGAVGAGGGPFRKEHWD